MYVGRRKDEGCRYSYGKDLELRGGRVGEPGRGWGKGATWIWRVGLVGCWGPCI